MRFRCAKCHSSTDQWDSRCLGCGASGTIAGIVSGEGNTTRHTLGSATQLQGVRISTGIQGLDKVLGANWRNPEESGLHVPSVVLFAGSGGAGKSTLLLHLVQRIILPNRRRAIQYQTSEQTLAEIKDNAERLGLSRSEMNRVEAYEVKHLNEVMANMKRTDPHVVIVDSLNELSDPQNDTSDMQANLVRTANAFKEESEKNKRAIILVSHMNKKEEVAGVQRMQHIVSAVMLLTRDNHRPDRRVLSCPKKNRWGNTADRAVFMMTPSGLVDMPEALDDSEDPSATGRARDA